MGLEGGGVYKKGGHHNAPSLMATVDFADVERLQHQGEWHLLLSTLQLATGMPATRGRSWKGDTR